MLFTDKLLQTLKKHNAYFSDEILGFLRGEPIPGNCYFWSAPSQPFVLSARVCNFESVCQRSSAPMAAVAGVPPNAKLLAELTAKAVKDTLVAHERLWLYRVSNLASKKENGWVAFSVDYLQNFVAQKIAENSEFKLMPDSLRWLQTRMPVEIEAVLNRHKARSGYVVLEGVTRAVWVLPQSEIKLDKGKAFRATAVEVRDRI